MALKVPKRRALSLLEQRDEAATRLELKLLESQYDWLDKLVDPRAAYVDELTGESWEPVGGSHLSAIDDEVPFRNEQELTWIRRQARRTVRRNPYAENLLINLTSFTVGKGHQYSVEVQKGVDTARAKPYQMELERFVTRLLKKNKWKQRQKETVRRYHRDGEAFIRIFPQRDGYALFRFVEPIQVKTPEEYHSDDSASFGIKTDPDDVETIELYFIDEEEVDAHEVQHRKANVDLNTKRGLSSIYCIGANLERGSQLLQNMATLVQTRAAIAMIRRHDRTPAAVRAFADGNATGTYTHPLTQEKLRSKRLRPGTVIDSTKKTEYEFPALNSSAGEGTDVLGAELRAVASSKALPEYMVGSDASNANYSSTMVSESPAVRFFEGEQDEWIEADLELIWAAIDYAIDAGVLAKECRRYCTVNAEPPELVTRDPGARAAADEKYLTHRVKSPQTLQTELGLDPAQEQKNWTEWDDSNLEGGPLPLGVGDGDQIQNQNINANNPEAVAALENPEAARLSMAGGITGFLEIMKAHGEGFLGRDQAIAAVKQFYKLSTEEAKEMVGTPDAS